MRYFQINQNLIDKDNVEKIIKICPFNEITYENNQLVIGAGCKMCGLCAKKSGGVIELKEKENTIDKSAWRGIAVFAQEHPVTFELIGKAKELAKVTGHPVYAVVIGYKTENLVQRLLRYGADTVFVYDAPELQYFTVSPYAAAFADFIENVKPSSILVGTTDLGRSLAPKVAARFRTGLTADCTMLEMRENTDLVQIRPAFGGNIMAQIITPNQRPQFCTVRYKIFSAPEEVEPTGNIVHMEVPFMSNTTNVLQLIQKPKEVDISEAEVIVAVGRGVKTKKVLEMVEAFAGLLGAQMACTRPHVESGWFDAKKQIGLSGRTVKPKLIITVGVSGAVQFVAGMSSSDCIVAINNDKCASIFDVAHYGLVGDLCEIIPMLISKIKESSHGL